MINTSWLSSGSGVTRVVIDAAYDRFFRGAIEGTSGGAPRANNHACIGASARPLDRQLLLLMQAINDMHEIDVLRSSSYVCVVIS